LLVIWWAASVIAYASRTGALKVFSRSWKVLGERGEEQDRMKRIDGIGFGSGDLSRTWWIVGTAEYQFALYLLKSDQNSWAENLVGTITEPPEERGAKNAAKRPWTWNSGITR
jgi:hypothetical protein